MAGARAERWRTLSAMGDPVATLDARAQLVDRSVIEVGCRLCHRTSVDRHQPTDVLRAGLIVREIHLEDVEAGQHGRVWKAVQLDHDLAVRHGHERRVRVCAERRARDVVDGSSYAATSQECGALEQAMVPLAATERAIDGDDDGKVIDHGADARPADATTLRMPVSGRAALNGMRDPGRLCTRAGVNG
jgi:hypothetical protein